MLEKLRMLLKGFRQGRTKRLMGFLKMKSIAAIQALLLGLKLFRVPCRHRRGLCLLAEMPVHRRRAFLRVSSQ